MDNNTHTLTQCCFTNVLLPIKFRNEGQELGRHEYSCIRGPEIQQWLQKTAAKVYDTYLQIAFYNGAMWVRLSGQIYLSIEDFQWVGEKLQLLCDRVVGGYWP